MKTSSRYCSPRPFANFVEARLRHSSLSRFRLRPPSAASFIATLSPAHHGRQDGVVKVVDFGIARVLETSRTQTGMLIGTFAYMSPEQYHGEHADERSDNLVFRSFVVRIARL